MRDAGNAGQEELAMSSMHGKTRWSNLRISAQTGGNRMATRRNNAIRGPRDGKTTSAGITGSPKASPQILSISRKGITTSSDFRDFMSALMSDVIAGSVSAQVTNAACNAGGKMLKMIDQEMKYGTRATTSR